MSSSETPRRKRRVLVVSSGSSSDSDESLGPGGAGRTRKRRLRVESSEESSGSPVVGRRRRLPHLRDSADSDSSSHSSRAGSTPAPVSTAVISAVSGFASDSSEGNSDKCSICLLRFTDQPVGTPQACEHVFCLDCITEWSKNVNTCPVDRITFESIVVRTCLGGRVLRTDPVKVIERRSSVDLLVVEDPTICEICGSSESEETMLLCDGCDLGFHMACLTPPLAQIPIDQWFCPDCAGDVQEEFIYLSEVNDLLLDIQDMERPRGARAHPLRQPRVQRTSHRARARTARDQPSTSAGGSNTLNIVELASTSRGAGSRRRAATAAAGRTAADRARTKRKRKRKIRRRGRGHAAARRSLVRASVAARLAALRDRDPTTHGGGGSRWTSAVPLAEARRRAAVPTLSLFGDSRLDLEYCEGEEGEGSDGGAGGGGGVLARAARPTAAVLSAYRQARRKLVSVPAPAAAAPPDLLADILHSQELFHAKHSLLELNGDGRLTVKVQKVERRLPKPQENNKLDKDKLDLNKAEDASRKAPSYPGQSRGGGGGGWGGGYRGNYHREQGATFNRSENYENSFRGNMNARERPQGPWRGEEDQGNYHRRPHQYHDEEINRRDHRQYPHDNRHNYPPRNEQRHSLGPSWQPYAENMPDGPPERTRHSFGGYQEPGGAVDMRVGPPGHGPHGGPSLPHPPLFHYKPSDEEEKSDPESLVIDTEKYDPTEPTNDESGDEDKGGGTTSVAAPIAPMPSPPLALKNILYPVQNMLSGVESNAGPRHVPANVLAGAVRQVLHEHRTLLDPRSDLDEEDDSDGDCPNFSIYSATSVHIASASSGLAEPPAEPPLEFNCPIPEPPLEFNCPIPDPPVEDQCFAPNSPVEDEYSVPESPVEDQYPVPESPVEDQYPESPVQDQCSIPEPPIEDQCSVPEPPAEVECPVPEAPDMIDKPIEKDKTESVKKATSEEDLQRQSEEEYKAKVSKRCPITPSARNPIKIKLNTPSLIKRVSLYDDEESLPEAPEPEPSPTRDTAQAGDSAGPDHEDQSPVLKDDVQTESELDKEKDDSEIDDVDKDNDKDENNWDRTPEIPPPTEAREHSDGEKDHAVSDTEIDLQSQTSKKGEEKMTESISETEDERSYTPCLDENKSKEDTSFETEKESAGIEGLDTEMISEDDNGLFSDSDKDKSDKSDWSAVASPPPITAAASPPGDGEGDTGDRPGPEDGEILDKGKGDDELDPKKKKKKDTKKDSKEKSKSKKKADISFKKLSKSNKERNYRDKDDKKRKNREDSDAEKERRKEKRKDLERYDVRNVVTGKRRRATDVFGRDVSPPFHSPSPYRSPSPASAAAAAARAMSSPPRSPRLYSPRLSPRRSPRHSPRRSPRHSPRRSPRRSPRLSPRRSPRRSLHRSPRRSPHRSPRRSPRRSLHRSPRRSPRRSLHRSPRRSLHRSPRRASPPLRKRRKSSSVPRRSPTPPRPRRRSLEKSKPSKKKKRSRSERSSSKEKKRRRKSPRKKSPKRKKAKKRSPSPELELSPEQWVEGGGWPPSPRTPPPAVRLALTPRKKKEKKRLREEKRHRRSKEAPTAPCKEVFTSGNNILVSVSFGNEEARHAKEGRRKARRRERRALGATAAAGKPVAIIDLERSPFRELTPSPKNVIVLSDGDEPAPPALAPAAPAPHAAPLVGPKTPPEPTVKFTLASKPPPVARANPLQEEEAPPSPPSSPDAYDPFEPTRSPSPSPATAAPPAGGAPSPRSPPAATPAAPAAATPLTPNTMTLEVAQKTNLSADDVLDQRPLTPSEKVMALLQSTRDAPPDAPPAALDAPPAPSPPDPGPAHLQPAFAPAHMPPALAHAPAPAPAPASLPAPPTPSKQPLPKLLFTKPSPIKSTPIKPMQSTKISKLPLPSIKPLMRKPRNGTDIIDLDFDGDSPYSPGSSDFGELFDPPAGRAGKPDLFDSLFGSIKRRKDKGSKFPFKHHKKRGKRTQVGVRLDDDNLKILDELPSSAVEMQVKSKFLKKLNRQERVVEEVKLVLKPHYNKKRVSKDEYKDILRRAVPKICHNKTGEINPTKIQTLVEAYVKKVRKKHKLGLA